MDGWKMWIWPLLIGYLLGYYFPQLGKATAGKIKAGPNG